MHVARVPLQHAWVLSADDLPNPIWSAVTTAQGQATKTFRWLKLEPSIGVSMGKRTYWDAEQNPELRDEALDRAAFRISELSSRYAIRNVYRVAVAPNQTAALIEIQFEEGINLTGRVRAGAMRVRTSCVGYLSGGGLVDWTINTDEPFSVLKAPKNRPFVLELGNASITIFTPVAAQAADHDAGLIDLRPFQSTRVVRVRGVYPLDYPANEKGTFLSFIRSDGLVIYNMYCAGDTIDAPLPAELSPDDFIGGAAEEGAMVNTGLLPAGTHAVFTRDLTTQEHYRSVATRLRAGASLASLGLFAVTVPAEGPCDLDICMLEVLAKQNADRPTPGSPPPFRHPQDRHPAAGVDDGVMCSTLNGPWHKRHRPAPPSGSAFGAREVSQAESH